MLIVGSALVLPGFLLAQTVPAEDSLLDQLSSASAAQNLIQVEELVKRNRLEMKPLVEALLASSIRQELNSEKEDAAESASLATLIATVFEKAFGERSLSLATGYLTGWSKSEKQNKLLADSLYASGTSLRGSRDTREEAIQDYERAKELYILIGDRIGLASTLGGLGYVSWFLDKDQYYTLNMAALELRREVDDQQLIGNSLNDVALAHRSILNDRESALEYYLQSEQVRIVIGDSLALARLLPNIARTYSLSGEYESALRYYNRAAAIAGGVGDLEREAVALRNAGAVSSDLGRLADALAYFEQALDVRAAQGVPAADILNHLGITYRRLGNFESALQHYQEVVKLATESGDGAELANASSNIGVVYLYAERPDRATRYFDRAKKQFQEIDDQFGVLNALINLGSAHFELRDYVAAQVSISEALALSRELEDNIGEATTLVLTGNVQNRLGQFDVAIDSFNKALVRAVELNVPDLIFASKLGLGETNEKRGSYDEAIRHYEEAFEVLESGRGRLHTDEDKAGYLAQQRYAYEEFIHMLTGLHVEHPDKGFDERAFLFAERAKARAFLDLLAESLADVNSGVDETLLIRQDSLLQRLVVLRNSVSLTSASAQKDEVALASLKAELAGAESEYTTLERDLREQNPRFADLQYPQPSPLSLIQESVLDDEVVLLEYSLGDSSSALWIATNDSRKLVKLPNRETIREQVELLRFALTKPDSEDTGAFANTAYGLYQMLIEPAAVELQTRKKIVIVPDDVLYYLPFEALITDSAVDDSVFKDLPYLVVDHAVSYAQSASILEQLTSDRDTRSSTITKGLLAFGDPVFESELIADAGDRTLPAGGSLVASLGRLPYSGAEVTSISSYFAAGDADVFLRGEATEDQIKSLGSEGRYRYLHLATHGLVDEKRPDFSAVVLAYDEDPTEDGLLQAAEIFNLNVTADLVVLSACETGLGRMVRGEGLVGLTRAFMYAGAPSVVVSLWSVADESTASLMDEFYSNLVRESAGKTESLRAAKMRLIESGTLSHPFHWAPFVLSGDWK